MILEMLAISTLSCAVVSAHSHGRDRPMHSHSGRSGGGGHSRAGGGDRHDHHSGTVLLADNTRKKPDDGGLGDDIERNAAIGAACGVVEAFVSGRSAVGGAVRGGTVGAAAGWVENTYKKATAPKKEKKLTHWSTGR